MGDRTFSDSMFALWWVLRYPGQPITVVNGSIAEAKRVFTEAMNQIDRIVLDEETK